MDLTTLAIAATPSFIASAVEFVEATTIVLAVGITRGWRAPLAGSALAALTLAAIVGTLGVALVTVVPEHLLLVLVGTLLLLFGLRWLRKAVLLEGIEVAFIVIAFGAKGLGAMNAAIVGAIAAGIIVIALAAALRHPLTAVPENWMKFGVGAMLSSFGVFWFGEGVGAEWPGDAASIPIILGSFLVASWLAVRLLGGLLPQGARVEARNV